MDVLVSYLLFYRDAVSLFLGNVDYAKFKAKWADVVKETRCEAEIETVFFVFASMSGKSDTSVINRADANAIFDFLAGEGTYNVTLCI